MFAGAIRAAANDILPFLGRRGPGGHVLYLVGKVVFLRILVGVGGEV